MISSMQRLTSFIFAYRFVNMDRFSLWLNQAPSTTTLLVIWCAICLVLGAVSTAIAFIQNVIHERTKHSAARSSAEASE